MIDVKKTALRKQAGKAFKDWMIFVEPKVDMRADLFMFKKPRVLQALEMTGSAAERKLDRVRDIPNSPSLPSQKER